MTIPNPIAAIRKWFRRTPAPYVFIGITSERTDGRYDIAEVRRLPNDRGFAEFPGGRTLIAENFYGDRVPDGTMVLVNSDGWFAWSRFAPVSGEAKR